MGKELTNAINQYEETFDDGFPTSSLMIGRTEKETVAIIERCIAEKKDVYELGYLELDDDTVY